MNALIVIYAHIVVEIKGLIKKKSQVALKLYYGQYISTKFTSVTITIIICYYCTI